MKKLTLLILLLIATLTASAQHRIVDGFSLGADRDTLMYIIASPFDNWFLGVSTGVQTFIGNTPDPQAYWNSLDYGGRIEVGKWIIPDVAVSLRLGMASAHSQTLHAGNNPWPDLTHPLVYDGAEYTYYPVRATAFTAQGIVTFDWTNFLNGYEAGKRRKLHVCTPFGFGGMILFGEIVNPNYVNRVNNNSDDERVVQLGDMAHNLELAFTGGLLTEYYATRHLSFNASLELLACRGSIDDYNYDLDVDKRRMDLVPSFYVGVKINMFREVTKRDPFTNEPVRAKVNHEFLAFGSRNTVTNLTERIERLNERIDSLQNLADNLAPQDSLPLPELQNELDSLMNLLDSLPPNEAHNIMEDLLNANEELDLPATIIYYKLDKFDIDYNGQKKLQRFAKEVNQLDDTIEYYIVGAADSITGSISHNQWLSRHRCQEPYDMLVKEFGVSANQLVIVPVGGIMEYDPQEYNRIALIIQRTKETEEIVNRWLQHKGRGDKTIAHPR